MEIDLRLKHRCLIAFLVVVVLSAVNGFMTTQDRKHEVEFYFGH